MSLLAVWSRVMDLRNGELERDAVVVVVVKRRVAVEMRWGNCNGDEIGFAEVSLVFMTDMD